MAIETYGHDWDAPTSSQAHATPLVDRRERSAYELFLKRPFDIVGSGVLLIVTAPLMAVVAVGVAITMGMPVVFRQRRVSRGGHPFTMYKFRSMLPESVVDDDESDSEFHAAKDSPRHTPFGQFIRRAALDELPQLWNVFKGDMSLIGPRPELPEVVEAFELGDHPRHLVRPGMTGAWQVSEFRDGYVHMNVHIDAAYVGNLTLRRDLTIALRTLGVLFGGAGEKVEAHHHADLADLADRAIDLRPVRVLHVLEPAIAGVPAYVEQLGQGLAERGIEQYVLTSDQQTWEFADWPVEVVRTPWRRRPLDALRVAREVRRLVDEHEIDLVHAHATFAGIATRVRRQRVPLLYQPHGWGYLSTRGRASARVARTIERVLDRRADVLLTLSDQEAATAPRRRVTTRVRPITDLEGFEPLPDAERRRARLEYGWSGDERIHLCVGELSHRKNQLPLASAWQRLSHNGDRLVLVGDGETRPALEDENERRIQLMGWRDDIPRLMGAADTLVVPSRGEGFTLVILEALASGLPVFTTPVGGSEVVNGGDGAIRESVDELVEAAISSDLPDNEPDTRTRRAERHQTKASVDTVADEFHRIYAASLGRPEPAEGPAVDLTLTSAPDHSDAG